MKRPISSITLLLICLISFAAAAENTKYTQEELNISYLRLLVVVTATPANN